MAQIELKAADGHPLSAYVARPESARGAVVVLQEIFGVNGHVRKVCDRYAEQGWLALAPALFDRAERGCELAYDAAGIARGRTLKDAVSEEAALLDVAAALAWAGAELGPRGRVAVIGFCWGGTLAWLAAARLPGLACAVPYYGTAIAAHLDEAPRVPVLLHFGRRDAHIPPADVDRIAASYPTLPLHRYEAGHGFSCDDRAAYDEASTRLAANRTRDFLNEHLPC